jgi:hypothetical protein
MVPNPKYQNKPLEFWANIKLLSQHIGYTDRNTTLIKIPKYSEILSTYDGLNLSKEKLLLKDNTPSAYMKSIVGYFKYRGDILNSSVKNLLMNQKEAKKEFKLLLNKLTPFCPLPMNKQKGKMREHAFFTCMINMLIESNLKGKKCNFDPKELNTFTHCNRPGIVMARRVDGAYPSTLNPKTIWEIKEYYYTTTFGSRIADGVYESLLDGYELNEVQKTLGISVKHYLFVDAYETWWELGGKSYLCRLIDMLHMGFIDEVIFGKEIFERIPKIVKTW